jgi:hypothetical protein
MSQSILSTPVSVIPQWNPTQILNINQKPDGNFTCSGVKNNTTIPCGYHLRGETAAKVSDLLDDISMLPPQTAIQSLRSLADASLCQYHKLQARGKVTEWTATINGLPPSTIAGPSITRQFTPSPSHRPTLAPQPPPSQPRGSSVSSWSFASRNRSQRGDNGSPSQQTTDGTTEDEIRQLKEDIMVLTARLASLETGSRDSANATSSRQVSRQPSTRTGLRSALFGRANS